MSDEKENGFCGFNKDAFYPSAIAIKMDEEPSVPVPEPEVVPT